MVIRFLSWCMCVIPLRVALFCGKLLGLFWFYCVPIRRKVGYENLDLAYGDELNKKQKTAILRACFVNLGKYLVEDLRLPLLTPEYAARLVKRHGFHHYEEALARKRGVIILCCHLDSWDLMALSQAHMGVELLVPVRLVHNKSVQAYIETIRKRAGMGLASPKDSFEQLVEHLQAGKTVAMILDQHMPKGRGVLVEFFGQPASTTPGCAVLAKRTGAAVVPVSMERQADGNHHLYIEPALDYEEPYGDDAENIVHNTQRYTAVIEQWIRQRPQDWLWLHKRWKVLQRKEFAQEVAQWKQSLQ